MTKPLRELLGALGTAINMLTRDKDEGYTVRGEIVEELKELRVFVESQCRSDVLKDDAPGLDASQVEWVVNSLAELGVKIGNQFFWLYKGKSLVYKDEPGETPLMWRPVRKREFGEVCTPVNYSDLQRCRTPHVIGTVSTLDGDEWNLLP